LSPPPSAQESTTDARPSCLIGSIAPNDPPCLDVLPRQFHARVMGTPTPYRKPSAFPRFRRLKRFTKFRRFCPNRNQLFSVRAPGDKIINAVAPDGGAHVCAPHQIQEGEGVIFCVVLPSEG
jgi:hypothetical protein